MKIRVISLLLTIALTLAMFLPAAHADTVSDSEFEAARLQNQIRQIYSAAQRNSGRYTFNGWCGTLVSWQLYLMGIDSGLHGADGKNQYDLYAARDVTCGGYGVKRYPASQYSLKQALNAITRNGTVDAYNILVGFQRTNTAAGQIYGHAMVIHGIVDGTVYFMECYATSLGGQYWAEGAPISCSIDTFCDYYNRWTVFDGVIHFGVKSYTQLCSGYGANMMAVMKTDTEALTEPVDEGINEASGVVENLTKGQQVEISGLFETPEGGLWYQVELQSGTGYVPADTAAPAANENAGVSLMQAQIPASAREGVGVVLRGNVSSLYGDLTRVQVQVYGAEEEPVLQAQMEVSGKTASLSDYRLDRDLTFRSLDVGAYRIVVTADVQEAYAQDGQVATRERTVTVWQSELRIVADWNYYYKVSFDGNGGDADADQWTMAAGQTLTGFPGAVRSGYRFDGWALDPEGENPVTPETVPQNSVTLYAQWTPINSVEEDPLNQLAESKWENGAGGYWYLVSGLRFLRHRDGSWPIGWYELDGQRYFFNENGVATTGWYTVDGNTYYFLPDGACVTGWQEMDGVLRYFDPEGALGNGWRILEDQQYYLDENGSPVTGWTTIDGAQCLFSEDGVLQMTLRGTVEDGYYVVYDRTAAEQMMDEDAKLLLG